MKKTIILTILSFFFSLTFAQISPKSLSIGVGGYAQYDGGKQFYYKKGGFGIYANALYHLNSHFAIGGNLEYTTQHIETDYQYPDTLLWTRATEKYKSRRFAFISRYYHELGSPKWQGFVQGSALFYNQFGAAESDDTGEFLYPLGGLIEIGFDLIPGIQYMPTTRWGIELTVGRFYVVSGLKGLSSYDHYGFSMPAKIGVNYFIFKEK